MSLIELYPKRYSVVGIINLQKLKEFSFSVVCILFSFLSLEREGASKLGEKKREREKEKEAPR